jgi:hypothetical protein
VLAIEQEAGGPQKVHLDTAVKGKIPATAGNQRGHLTLILPIVNKKEFSFWTHIVNWYEITFFFQIDL